MNTHDSNTKQRHWPQFSLRTLLIVVLISGPLLAALVIGLRGDRKVNPTRGRIMFQDGTPLQSGVVSFLPVNPRGRAGTSVIQPDGSFTVSTFEPGDGLLSGEYRFAISVLNPAGREMLPKYALPTKSGLTFLAQPGENQLDLMLSGSLPPKPW